MTESQQSSVCPVCQDNYVPKRGDGTLFPHTRYADGAGRALGLSNEQVACEGAPGQLWESALQQARQATGTESRTAYAALATAELLAEMLDLLKAAQVRNI